MPEHLLSHARHDVVLLPVAERLGTFSLAELEAAVADDAELRASAVFWLASAEARRLVVNQARLGGDLRDYTVVERSAGPALMTADELVHSDRILDELLAEGVLPAPERRNA